MKIEKIVGVVNLSKNLEEIKLIVALWGFEDKLDIKEEMRAKWIEFAKSIIKGYESKCEITSEEKMSIKYMVYAIELIMIAFFARDGYTEIADSNIKMINWISLVWNI